MRVSLSPSSAAHAVIIALTFSYPGTSALASASDAHAVHCAGGRSFQLQIAEHTAIASFEGRRLILPQRPSPLGASYQSADGALLIDGHFVAFVPTGDADWRDCEIQTKVSIDIPS